jgi:hypothetical protein
MIAMIVIAGMTGNAGGESLTDQMVRLGASRARDCLKVAASAGQYKADQMHGYADCIKSVETPVAYSSDNEKLTDAGLFVAGRYILKREFGEIDQKSYGTLGKNQFNEIDAGYKWALIYLENRGSGKDAACAAIGWVDCKVLP